MPQFVVVADDLTGGNATGVLMTKNRLRTYTVFDEANYGSAGDCDCVICITDSRGIDPGDAYRRVYGAVQTFRGDHVLVYAKRIDSTLRGNLGSETDAMLDALDNGAVAMIVPCFPASKRTTVGGYQLVGGLPIHKTKAAADPKNPVDTPSCAEVFRRQSRYPVGSVYLGDLIQGPSAVAGRIRRLAGEGVRGIVFDAVTGEDTDLIAEAVIRSRVPFIAVDPGVFTAAVSKRVAAEKGEKQPKILAAVGSVNGVVLRQVEAFLAAGEVCNTYIDTGELLEGPGRREAEIARVCGEILGREGGEVYSVIGKGIHPEHRVPFAPYAQRLGCGFDDLSATISRAIAEIARRIVEGDGRFRGLYSCGGDITVEICRAMGCRGMHLHGEILPLAAYCTLAGGDHDGLKIVTKGGMVGEPNAMVTCIAYLQGKLSQQQTEE